MTRCQPAPRRAEPGCEADRVLLERRLLEAGLRAVDRVMVHENRSVMLSCSRRVLRVHRGFAYASDRVLRAIVGFVSARTRRARQKAARQLLAFPVHRFGTRRPTRPRRPRAASADLRWLRALRELHGTLNRRHFDGRLSRPTFRVSARMRTRLGEVAAPEEPGAAVEIGISRRHLERDGWDAVTRTLLHEMVHQWQVESKLPLGHGRAFRRKAREVGLERPARRTGARGAGGGEGGERSS